MDIINRKLPVIKQRIIIHDNKYRKCVLWNRVLSAIHITLTSLIGSLTTMQMTMNDMYLTYSIFVVGWFIAIVTGIINFTKFPNKMDAHHQAVLLYTGLIDQVHEVTDEVGSRAIIREYRRIKRVVPYVGVIKTSKDDGV
jgi:hypothetical protein